MLTASATYRSSFTSDMLIFFFFFHKKYLQKLSNGSNNIFVKKSLQGVNSNSGPIDEVQQNSALKRYQRKGFPKRTFQYTFKFLQYKSILDSYLAYHLPENVKCLMAWENYENRKEVFLIFLPNRNCKRGNNTILLLRFNFEI